MRQRHFAIKNHLIETDLFRTRCLIIIAIITLCSFFVIGRLVFLQISEHHFYSSLSHQNLMGVIPVEPNRGLIYDRNGILLAKNVPTFTLAVLPHHVKNLDDTLAQINDILPLKQEEIDAFKHIKYQYRPFQPVPLKYKLSEQEVAQYYVNRYRLPGMTLQTQMLRAYPLGETTAHIVGYVGRINASELRNLDPRNYNASEYIGKVGIEKYYEKALHGAYGAEEAEINASGQIIRSLKRINPKPGDNLYLTIDSQLQAVAEKAMGKETGAIVIMQPSTGEVLAMVSHPSYDPNPFVTGLSHRDYQKLQTSPDHPLYNRAIHGQFASGSTIKPFFALIALDDKIISTAYKIFDTGWFQLPNTQHVYHDWHRSGHGWVNVSKAIIVSCDTFFYKLAVSLGIKKIDAILNQFGFGQLTGIDMPKENAGLVPTPEWKRGQKGASWYTGDTIEVGIGQGFMLASPLQLAQAVSTIANRGQRFKPHLLLKTKSPDGQIHLQKPEAKMPIMLHHPETWNTVIKAMRGVVDHPEGTAELYGKHPDYTVAAKTGTAQVYGHHRDEDRTRTDLPKKLRNNHLFIAFAPVERPQIAIAVIVEHNAMADRMTNTILTYYFKNLKHDKPLRSQ